MDFGKLTKTKSGSAPTKLVDLFEQLDRKATHQILRPVQVESLHALDAQLNEHDVVLKVSTGSGKTLVGLVFAEMMRRKYPGEPVIFLCPTTQLIDQVLHTAAQIGVTAESFQKDVSRPLHAIEGRSVLVCTYDKLFTARNIFEQDNIVPSAIILDDVHSGVDRVRQKYSVPIPALAYDQIKSIFQSICESSDPAVWRGIANNEAHSRFEVPYWLWVTQCNSVAHILEKHKDDIELRFCWANVSRYLEYARLCISGTSAELSLLIPATEENKSYAGAKHRLFMSASIKDGTALIRDLACNEAAIDRVIEPPSDKGAGERMILPVALIDHKLEKCDIAALCQHFAKETNVVALTSSGNQSAVWAEAGALAKQGSDVDAAVSLLRSTSKGNFFVFAQRFDGVDLPDDACRILVIDGTPIGDRLCDQIDAERQKNSPGHNTRVVNRLEQALGRAVRSSADFAAILLVGSDLASFIGRRDVKQLLEPHTREQIELGRDLAEQIKGDEESSLTAIGRAIEQLLKRNEGWKEAHRDRVSTVVRVTRAGTGLTVNEKAAVAERKAWVFAKSRNHQAAVTELQKIIDEPDLHEIQRAELIFRMAGYMHHFDQAKAATLYRGAFLKNSLLPRPVQMPDRKNISVREQSVALSEALQEFSSANAAIAKLEEVRARLAYSGDPESVERALHEFGKLLGATSSRPEKETGRGPDILWEFDGISLCIEAKNEKHAPIFKCDAEQLLLSLEWCVTQASISRVNLVSVFATNTLTVDRSEDISFGPSILSEKVLMEMVESLMALVTGQSFDGPLFRDVVQINQRLHSAGLAGKDLVKRLGKLPLG
ncbi:MAG: DEAD/DEAH box helicase family protein [Candidatus Nitrotoga sp.]